MEATERTQPAGALPTRSPPSQASLYAYNAAESAAHSRPSTTGLQAGQRGLAMASCCASPAHVYLVAFLAFPSGFAPVAVVALLNDLAALVSRRAARRRDLHWSSISKEAAAQAVAAEQAVSNAAAAAAEEHGGADANTGDEEKQKVSF